MKHIKHLNLSDTDHSTYSYTNDANIERAVGRLGGHALTRLTIHNGGSSNNGMKAIVQGCPHLRSLKVISCDGISPGDLGMSHILTAAVEGGGFGATLQEFCLIGSTSLTEKGIVCLFEACPALRVFSLEKWNKRYSGGAGVKTGRLVSTAAACPRGLVGLWLVNCTAILPDAGVRFAAASAERRSIRNHGGGEFAARVV